MTKTAQTYRDCIEAIIEHRGAEAPQAADSYFDWAYGNLIAMHRSEDAADLANWWGSHPDNPYSFS